MGCSCLLYTSCDVEIVENGGEDLIQLSAPDLPALSVKRLFHGVENFLLLKGNGLPVSFSDLHFDPLLFSGHFSDGADNLLIGIELDFHVRHIFLVY